MGHNITHCGILQPLQKSIKKKNWETTVPNKTELLHQALYKFKESGYLEQALVNWHAQPEQDQTWMKAKEQFNKE